MEEILILICGILLFSAGIFAFINFDDNKESGAVALVFSQLFIGAFFYILGLKGGEEDGAYKMLHNEYNVRYVMTTDSVVSDTIIVEFNK